MRRKDYENAARIVQKADDPVRRAAMVRAFSEFFAAEPGSLFDEERFAAACVPGANVRAREQT